MLGPILRYVDTTSATVWVETDGRCEVEVLGHWASTFCIHGRHYALVTVDGLEPDSLTDYEVALDGDRRWPSPDLDMPPSAIRTLPGGGVVRLAVGSCRVPAPHEPPYDQPPATDSKAIGIDALETYARRMAHAPPDEWPHVLLLLGDQVYGDEDPTELHVMPVPDYEAYAELYDRAWSMPVVRWLFSVVPTAMVFDDHDVIDDWNISQDWVDEIREQDWWDDHAAAALMSYWVYQQLGNLSPRELEDDEVFAKVCAEGDGADVLRPFAVEAEVDTGGEQGVRWSHCRDLGPARLVVIDSRNGRVLEPGRRSIIDEDEEDWVEEQATDSPPHLLLASSVPFLTARGFHEVERWNEAVAEGAWGRWCKRPAEKIRRGLDLEHWAAFGRSFAWLERLLQSVASGERGPPPATITMLSGDVHFHYISRGWFEDAPEVRSRIHQVVSSPIRHGIDREDRVVLQMGGSKVAAWLGRALRRSARVGPPELSWWMEHGPWFRNGLVTLEMDEQRCRVMIDALPEEGGDELERVCELDLAQVSLSPSGT